MRVCCVSPHHLINNPRLFREAGALAQAGHQVRVITVSQIPEWGLADAQMAKGQKWRLDPIFMEKKGKGKATWLSTGARKFFFKSAWKFVRRGAFFSGIAYTRTFFESMRRIESEPTDLIIAHTQAMLAPAYFSAKKMGCRWGFDLEDILSREDGEGIRDKDHQALVAYLEDNLIPRADFVTAASVPYKEWLISRYGLKRVAVIENVESLKEAPQAPVEGFPQSRPYLSLYWFSQSIGSGRGLEDIIQALPFVEVPVELHLRGWVLPDFKEPLAALIERTKTGKQIHFHDRLRPFELAQSIPVHDIGLSLEHPYCLNRDYCVTNKLFAYLMGGLAVGVTQTRGHESVLGRAPGVGFSYAPGDFKALAACLNDWGKNPERLMECRKQALVAARSDFNYESQQKAVLEFAEGVERHSPILK